MKNHKTSLLLVIAVLAACTGTDSDKTATVRQDVFDQVNKRGVIRAAYFVQPPAVMRDPNSGKVSGTFVKTLDAIAAEAGWKVDYTEIDIAKFAAGLDNGQYDVCIGPTFRTVPRAKAVEFTIPLYFIGYDGVVKRGREATFTSEGAVDRDGVTVAVKEGSAIHTYAIANFKHAHLLVLSGVDLTLPLQAVASGQADIGLMNEHTVEYFARKNPTVAIVLRNNPIQVLGMSWSVQPGNPRWLNFLNTSLEEVIATGRLSTWERSIYGDALRRGSPQ
jgi:polar amino acid transport system substrate-binding protein